jgi:hypothetical protein
MTMQGRNELKQESEIQSIAGMDHETYDVGVEPRSGETVNAMWG